MIATVLHSMYTVDTIALCDHANSNTGCPKTLHKKPTEDSPVQNTDVVNIYTVLQKTRTPVKSSNSCTEYDPISVIFGLENSQRVFICKKMYDCSEWKTENFS